MLVVPCVLGAAASLTTDLSTPEAVVRALFQANAERDLPTMEKLLAQDADMIGYTIGGRKFTDWNQLALALKEEFDSVSRLEFPITDLHVWTRGDMAWYVAEADYIRYLGNGGDETRTVLPLRETGVMERRNGQWVVVHWHESLRSPFPAMPQKADTLQGLNGFSRHLVAHVDLSGEWEVQEEDKHYRATLDVLGNGSYSWQGGRIMTSWVSGHRWEGVWHQPGNDREGGFELVLSEDRTAATGIWWYTRVGEQAGITPRQWGGNYRWKRLTEIPEPALTKVP
jgi:hypothetical protein